MPIVSPGDHLVPPDGREDECPIVGDFGNGDHGWGGWGFRSAQIERTACGSCVQCPGPILALPNLT